jgi:toxin YoeB
MAKKIIWSLKAQNNRKEIFNYWNHRNQSNLYSLKLNLLFIEAANLIAKFPKIGKPTGYKETRVKSDIDLLVDIQIGIENGENI